MMEKQLLKIGSIFVLFTFFCVVSLSAESIRPRVLVLTDIENEPDDAMSMVRFLTYSNQWDIEGLVATTSIHQKKETAAWRIREIVDAYDEVRDNLLKHESDYPSADHLRSIIKEGRADYGMGAVGDGMDSEGSDWIIHSVDSDTRPLWVLVWGGPNCLAQALWKVQQTRTPEEVKVFVSKLRVYAISDQDDSGPWIRKNFKDLFYIVSPGFHAYGGYHHCTWSGISGDKFHGRFSGADHCIVDNPWLDEHVRSKGPLGAQYPHMTFLMEGDSPTFMYLINNGLGSPEYPNWGSWGGRYEYYQPRTEKWFLEPETRPIWGDAVDEVLGVDGYWHTSNKATIWRWREAYQNDFAARMDWTVKSYKEANHPPVVKLNGERYITAKVGDRVSLSVKATDPDGDRLSFRWFYYGEPGTFTLSTARTGNPLEIEDADKPDAWFVIPKKFGRLGTMHFIVEVTDNGVPALTRYERVIVSVEQNQVPMKPRILVSTDIGGTDPDDFQSMVHLLMYNDRFDIEGLVSSPSFGHGTKQDIFHIIDLYEKDLPQLKEGMAAYYSPERLRELCKQGRHGAAPLKGYSSATEGSDWIVQCARQKNDRPLWILVWGGLEDLAQALHDAPDIEDKIRVYWIGGPNKKWSVNSYVYIVENFPNLWMIENNASYRGFITNNKILDDYNANYYDTFIRGAGHLGEDFIKYYNGIVKMGDTPSLLYMMDGDPDDPQKESWGGSFEKLNFSPRTIFNRNTTEKDTVTVYSVIEFHIKGPKVNMSLGTPCITMRVDKQDWDGYYMGKGKYVVKYSPKATAKLTYKITSTVPGFKDQEGVFVVNNTWPGTFDSTDYKLGSNWYTDKSELIFYEGQWQGSKTVSKWRSDVLKDWADRWNLLK